MLRISGLACLALGVAVNAAYPYVAPRDMLPPEGCTSIAVDPHASIDGGMTTHTNDCHECDSRISKVPARDWPEGSKRPIYKYRSAYPRYLGPDRGDTYEVANTDLSFYEWKPSDIVGYVPQVAHTYAYIDGHYGIQNEHQVAIGESTCTARLVAIPIFDGGKALLEIQQLSRIGLERSKTARELVKIMGELAETYGYYGAAWRGLAAEGEAGEVLMISDPYETYTFHILPDSTGTSAIWVAQKIPKGHIAVCANSFFIKEVDFNDKENFLYSANMLDEAKKNNFYDEAYGPFHFTNTFGLLTTFEKYSSRRAWRVLSVAAPSLGLQANETIDSLPFSVKPDRLLNKTDLMWLQRDHFEGTEYDATQGLQSGPYGNPTRYDPSPYFNITAPVLFQGRFERTISIHRTIYSFVTLSRADVPSELSLLWFSSAIPHASYYQPVYVASKNPPAATMVGSLHGYDRRSSFWAATTIEGWMEKCYKLTAVDVAAAQLAMETKSAEESAELEKKVLKLTADKKHSEVVDLLTDFVESKGRESLTAWWSLFEKLVTKYHDGFRVDNLHVDEIAPRPVFYPLYWLNAVGYFLTPNGLPNYNITTWQYAIHPPTLPPHTSSFAQIGAPFSSVEASSVGSFMILCVGLGMGMAVGVFAGMRLASKQQRDEYAPIQQL